MVVLRRQTRRRARAAVRPRADAMAEASPRAEEMGDDEHYVLTPTDAEDLLARLRTAAERSRRRRRRSGGVEYDPGQRCQARWPTSRRSVPRQQPPPAPRRLTTPEAALWKAVEAFGAAGMGTDGCGRAGRFSARCAVGGTMACALTGCVVHACRQSARNGPAVSL